MITLPAGPLLERVCLAAQRQLTAVWLTLASMLTVQLAKPTLDLANLKLVPNPDAQGILSSALPLLLQSSLQGLGQPGAMEAVGILLCLSNIMHSCQGTSESRHCTGLLWVYGCRQYSRWIHCEL